MLVRAFLRSVPNKSKCGERESQQGKISVPLLIGSVRDEQNHRLNMNHVPTIDTSTLQQDRPARDICTEVQLWTQRYSQVDTTLTPSSAYPLKDRRFEVRTTPDYLSGFPSSSIPLVDGSFGFVGSVWVQTKNLRVRLRVLCGVT